MRQQQLLEQYHFRCRCSACSQGPCSEADANLVGMRCAMCAGPTVPSLACEAGVCSLQALPSQLPGAGRCFQCVPFVAAAWVVHAVVLNGATLDVLEISHEWSIHNIAC